MNDLLGPGGLAIGSQLFVFTSVLVFVMRFAKNTFVAATASAVESAKVSSAELLEYRAATSKEQTALRSVISDLEARMSAQMVTMMGMSEQLALCRVESADAIQRERKLQTRVELLEQKLGLD